MPRKLRLPRPTRPQTEFDFIESTFEGKYVNLIAEDGKIISCDTDDIGLIAYLESRGLQRY